MIYKTYTHIDEIAVQWDHSLPSDHHLQSRNLKILEESKIKSVSFYYLTFQNDRRDIVGVAYFQWLHFTKEHYAFPISKTIFLNWVEEQIMRKGFRILVCGNLLRINAPGLYFEKSKTTFSEIFLLLEEFYKTLKPSPHAILIKDWQYEQDKELINQFNYEKWQPDSTMKLRIWEQWRSMDDYIKSLRHRYSQRYRKIRRMLFPVVRRELALEEIKKLGTDIENLYLNVVHRQPIRLLVVNKDYFSSMKEKLSRQFRIMGYFLEDRLVAFSSNIVHGQLWELHYIGLNYRFNKTHSLYFNILFDASRDAIGEGCVELELGRTAQSSKELLGALPTYFNNYVRIKSNIARRVVGYLRDYFNEQNELRLDTKSSIKPLKGSI